ncbi:8917_t:CDS:2, partial [Ambispora gerdemannii]
MAMPRSISIAQADVHSSTSILNFDSQLDNDNDYVEVIDYHREPYSPITPTDDCYEATTATEAVTSPQEITSRRKAGRPKGSKNKKNINKNASNFSSLVVGGSADSISFAENGSQQQLTPPIATQQQLQHVPKRPKRKKSEGSTTLLPPPQPSMIEVLVTFISKVQCKDEPRRLSREEMIRVGTYIFDNILSHSFARPFVNPVPFDAYYYRSQIPKLMDLTTAEQKLWAGKYKKVSDLYADIIQIMVNAVTFHREGALIYEEARQMCEYFVSEIYPLVNECLFDDEPSPNIPPMPLPSEEFDESCFNHYRKKISDLYLIPIATVRENKKVLTGNAAERLEIFCHPLIEIFTDKETPPVNFDLTERTRNFARLYCTGGRDMLSGSIDDPYAVAVIMSDIQYSKTTETMKSNVLVVKPFGPQHDLSTVDFPEINDARCWVRCAIINRLMNISLKLPWNYFGKTLPYSVIKLEEVTVNPQFYHDLMDSLEFDYSSSESESDDDSISSKDSIASKDSILSYSYLFKEKCHEKKEVVENIVKESTYDINDAAENETEKDVTEEPHDDNEIKIKHKNIKNIELINNNNTNASNKDQTKEIIQVNNNQSQIIDMTEKEENSKNINGEINDNDDDISLLVNSPKPMISEDEQEIITPQNLSPSLDLIKENDLMFNNNEKYNRSSQQLDTDELEWQLEKEKSHCSPVAELYENLSEEEEKQMVKKVTSSNSSIRRPPLSPPKPKPKQQVQRQLRPSTIKQKRKVPRVLHLSRQQPLRKQPPRQTKLRIATTPQTSPTKSQFTPNQLKAPSSSKSTTKTHPSSKSTTKISSSKSKSTTKTSSSSFSKPKKAQPSTSKTNKEKSPVTNSAQQKSPIPKKRKASVYEEEDSYHEMDKDAEEEQDHQYHDDESMQEEKYHRPNHKLDLGIRTHIGIIRVEDIQSDTEISDYSDQEPSSSSSIPNNKSSQSKSIWQSFKD